MADADDLNFLLLASEQLTYGLGLCLDGAGGSLLHEDVTVLAVLEGKQDEVHGLFKAHDKAGHLRLGQRNGVALANLVYPKRNHTAARAHHVAVTCAAYLRIARKAALGHGYLLLDGLRDAHRVDGIRGLVRGEANHALHTGIDGGIERVVRTHHIGLHGLHREELARRNLLQSSGMEHVVHALHGVLQRALVANVADVELDLVGYFRHAGLEVVAHIVLLLLIARKDADFTDVGAQETVQHCISKGTGTTGNQKDFVFKY